MIDNRLCGPHRIPVQGGRDRADPQSKIAVKTIHIGELCVCACVCVCMCVFVCVCMCVFVGLCKYECFCVYVRACVCVLLILKTFKI